MEFEKELAVKALSLALGQIESLIDCQDASALYHAAHQLASLRKTEKRLRAQLVNNSNTLKKEIQK